MNLFDSTKKKVVAGATAVALISGGGFALANTDVGTQLKDWYAGQFDAAVEQAEGEAVQYGENQLPGLANEYNDLKNKAVASINAKRDGELSSGTDAIAAAKDGHLSDLEAAKTDLLGEAEQKFWAAFSEGDAEIQRLAELGKNYAENELTGLTTDTGESAVDQVNADLDKAKEDAVTELEEAINSAKEALTADLNKKSERLTYNLVTQIDHAVDGLRDNVREIKNNLVEEQKEIIANAASEKVQEAEEALDEVVAGVNN